MGQIDSQRMVLRITGKGRKDRQVPLAPPTLESLRAFWKFHHSRPWLFPARLQPRSSRGEGPVDPDNLRLAFNTAASLKTLCADPRWMGGQPALTGVLHTWTRAMLCHSHAHFLVSAGGLSGDGSHWRPAQHPAALPLLALTMLSANLATPVLDSPASDPKPLLCPHCRIGWLVCLGPLRPRRKIPP